MLQPSVSGQSKRLRRSGSAGGSHYPPETRPPAKSIVKLTCAGKEIEISFEYSPNEQGWLKVWNEMGPEIVTAWEKHLRRNPDPAQ